MPNALLSIDNSLGYVIASKMDSLFQLQGDRVGGIERFLNDIEKTASDPGSVQLFRAQYYARQSSAGPEADRSSMAAKARASLDAFASAKRGDASRHALAFAAALLFVLLACAPAARGAGASKDPLERFNRATFAFNDLLDRMVARPAARAYKRAVPEPVRHSVSNFVANLAYPTVAVNSALQGKLRDAGSDTARFLVNTVLGIGGLFDPASHMGLAAHDEDFGQTLGAWGVPAGP